MFFLNSFFLNPTKNIPPRQRAKEKIRLQNLYNFYSEKIKHLTQKKINTRVALLVCRDSPVKKLAQNTPSETSSYIKNCVSHYKKKLREIAYELKKVS